ncbi:MAG: hypothetical protein ACTHOD_02805 [Motilibacteraceae bacterium]
MLDQQDRKDTVGPRLAHDRPVVALYDGSSAAEAALTRAQAYGAGTVLVGPRGARERLGRRVRAQEWVEVATPSLDDALAAAERFDAPWVSVPSTLMPPEDLLTRGLLGIAPMLSAARPGLVLHVVRAPSRNDPPLAYRRVVAVNDLDGAHGVAAYAAAAVAARAHAELDVLLLGTDAPVGCARELATAMARRTDPARFELARELLARAAVPVRYLPVPVPAEPPAPRSRRRRDTPEPLGPAEAAALRSIERLCPDLLVVELDGVRPGGGALTPTEASAVLSTPRARLVSALLSWLAVDVAVVVDEVGVGAPGGAAERERLARALDRALDLRMPALA